MVPKYRCRFQLAKADGSAVEPKNALDIVRSWVQQREQSLSAWPTSPTPLTLATGSKVIVDEHAAEGLTARGVRYDAFVAGQKTHWITDVGLQADGTGTTLFVSLGVSTVGIKAGGRLQPPLLVRRMVETFDARMDGRRLTITPWAVSLSQVADFLAFLQAPTRGLPVVAVTVDAYTEKPMLDPGALQERVVGLAHVAVIAKQAALKLTSEFAAALGDKERARMWTTYNGAVRIYWPGISLADPKSSPFDHPLWLPQEAIDAADDIFAELRHAAVHRHHDNWIDTAEIARRRMAHEIKSGKQEAELLVIYEAMHTEASAQIDTLSVQVAESVQRGNEQAKMIEWLKYNENRLGQKVQELEKKLAQVEAANQGEYLLAVFNKGAAKDRDILEEICDEYPEEADDLREGVQILRHESSWSKSGGKLSALEGDIFEFRVNLASHWFRFYCAKIPKLRTVVLLHGYAKAQNKLDPDETKIARDRRKNLFK